MTSSVPIEDREPHFLQKLCDCHSIEEAIDKHAIPLCRIKREKGEKFLVALLKLELLRFNTNINVKSRLSRVEITGLAENIAREYGTLTIADLALFLERVENNEYGELYESLNRGKVMRMLKTYFDERMEIAEDRSQSMSVNSDDQMIKSTMRLNESIPLSEAIYEWSAKMNQGYLEMDKVRRMTKGERRAKYWNEFYAKNGYAPSDTEGNEEAKMAIDRAKTMLKDENAQCNHMLHAQGGESAK